MKKLTFGIILCFAAALLLFTGCEKNYTKEDLDKILERSKIEAEFISEETRGEDVIWTYRDEKTGMKFRFIEHRYRDFVFDDYRTVSEILNEYPYLMTERYIQYTPCSAAITKEYHHEYTDVMTNYILTYEFTTEKDLKRKVKEFNKVTKKLYRKNHNCKLTVVFKHDWYSFSSIRMQSGEKIRFKDVLRNYRNTLGAENVQ